MLGQEISADQISKTNCMSHDLAYVEQYSPDFIKQQKSQIYFYFNNYFTCVYTKILYKTFNKTNNHLVLKE